MLITELRRVEVGVKLIRNNPKIADSNEAIMSYLEKVQNRQFLQLLLLLLRQLNESRAKKDFELMHRLRSLLIDLNFQQIDYLTRQPNDAHLLLSKSLEFADTSAIFT